MIMSFMEDSMDGENNQVDCAPFMLFLEKNKYIRTRGAGNGFYIDGCSSDNVKDHST